LRQVHRQLAIIRVHRDMVFAPAEFLVGVITSSLHAGRFRTLAAVVSYWRPSVEELAVLNAGGSIALWVLGATMPPVNLSIEGA
jgi:hypothetical protein